ncbi:MAG: hypothetical protein WEB06_16400 [Actinomycetota bacterium]
MAELVDPSLFDEDYLSFSDEILYARAERRRRRVHIAVRTFTVPEIRDWLIGAGFTALDALGAEGGHSRSTGPAWSSSRPLDADRNLTCSRNRELGFISTHRDRSGLDRDELIAQCVRGSTLHWKVWPSAGDLHRLRVVPGERHF